MVYLKNGCYNSCLDCGKAVAVTLHAHQRELLSKLQAAWKAV